MTDYTWPSVFFAYFFFLICFVGAIYFFVRSWKDGYWDPAGEEGQVSGVRGRVGRRYDHTPCR